MTPQQMFSRSTRCMINECAYGVWVIVSWLTPWPWYTDFVVCAAVSLWAHIEVRMVTAHILDSDNNGDN